MVNSIGAIDYDELKKAVKEVLSQSLLTQEQLSYDNSSGTSAVDYTVFSNDVAINFNGTIVIQIMVNQSTTVQVKLNGLIGFLNSGNNLNANSWYEFEMNVNNGDALNFIVQVPAGVNLTGLLRIFKRER